MLRLASLVAERLLGAGNPADLGRASAFEAHAPGLEPFACYGRVVVPFLSRVVLASA